MKLVEKSRLKAFKVDKILLEKLLKNYIQYVGYIPRTWDISQVLTVIYSQLLSVLLVSYCQLYIVTLSTLLDNTVLIFLKVEQNWQQNCFNLQQNLISTHVN
jgi:hypothetical protein